MITPEHLAEIKEYCAKATAGPWFHRQAGDTRKGGHPLDWIADAPHGENHHKIIIGRECLYGGVPDYAFIANARTDLPLLVAAYEQMRQQFEDERDRANEATCDIKGYQSALSAAQKRIEELKCLLKKAHDAMHSWHSSEYADHPLSHEVSKGLYQ